MRTLPLITAPQLLTFLFSIRRNIVARSGAVFTLMVAGESGLGKCTCDA